ncbi:MAG: alpha/beta hydrolase, partial [Chloroflexota bacterium]
MPSTAAPDHRDWRATRARPAEGSGFVERDGVRVFWETFGRGDPPILMLPTWSVLHAAHGRFQIADLARDHRIITFDGRGNGRSDRPTDPAAYADREFVADALAVLDATRTDRALVVACSQATFWQLGLAAEHPDRVLGIVASGSNLPMTQPQAPSPDAVGFDEPYVSTDGWAKWNAAYWRDDYEDFLRFFFSQVWTEPHSLSVIEDCVGWGMDTTPEVLIASATGPHLGDRDRIHALIERLECPALVIHGGDDAVSPVERSKRLAEAIDGRLAILDGAGHCSGNRDPVRFDLLIREFADSLADHRGTVTRWRRAIDRPRRVLFVPEGGSVTTIERDLAIIGALRAVDPAIDVSWLVGPSSRALVEARGERVEAMSDDLLDDQLPDGPDGVPRHDLGAARLVDEARFANFMAFDELVTREPFDLVVADGAWHIDHYLHQDPERKRFALAWLTDRVGWRSRHGETSREAALRADANAEMVAGVERFPRLRDVAIFLGDKAGLENETLGPGLPTADALITRHFVSIETSADDPGGARQI